MALGRAILTLILLAMDILAYSEQRIKVKINGRIGWISNKDFIKYINKND